MYDKNLSIREYEKQIVECKLKIYHCERMINIIRKEQIELRNKEKK